MVDSQTTFWQKVKCFFGFHVWDYEGDMLNEKGIRGCKCCQRREKGRWVSYDGCSATIEWRITYDK